MTAEYTPSYPGAVNSGTDTTNLFLKVFPGEILTSFTSACKTIGRHRVRSITSGKSAQFPAVGKITAAYHVAGVGLTGTQINHNERVITIDSSLIAHTFVDDVDMAMSQYDVRGPYADELGRALAIQLDKHVLQVGVLAGRASTTISGGDGGGIITNAQATTSAKELAKILFDGAQTLDEKNVPETGRVCFLSPAQYNLLSQNTDLINKQYGGAGAIQDGTVFRVAGLEIVKTNNLPSSVIAGATGENNTYSGTFTYTCGLIMQEEAVGTVKLMDLAVEQETSVRYQGTLMVAKICCGHGILRPECAIEIRTAAN